MANELGIHHRGFIADVDRWGEVWNQPVYGFKSNEVAAGGKSSDSSAPGTVREVTVHTEMYYADELPKELWQPVVGTPNFVEGVKKYDYVIELDANGTIIGGHWLSSDRPDFLWTKTKRAFTGDYAALSAIYRPAPVPGARPATAVGGQ